MNRLTRNLFCQLLIVLMAWTPFQLSHAGMIATEQALPAMQPQLVLTRAAVVAQLQAFGVDPALARERVQAITDQELGALNKHIATLPAGADISLGLVLVVLLIAGGLYWWFYMKDRR